MRQLFAGLAQANGLPALVDFSVGAAVHILSPRYCSAPCSSLFSITLFILPIIALLIELLLHGLLTNTIVAEVVELLKLVNELALLHLAVHLRDQVMEGCLYV